MQRRFRMTRLVSATIFVVLGVALLAAGVLVEGFVGIGARASAVSTGVPRAGRDRGRAKGGHTAAAGG